MVKRTPFNFHQVHEFLESLYAEDMHAKRVLSFANATLGVMTSASLGRRMPSVRVWLTLTYMATITLTG